MGKILIPTTGVSKIAEHPFKEGVRRIINSHFHPSIADNFLLVLEKEIYNNESIHIWKQKRDSRWIMEVRYKMPGETSEYICDLASWWSKPECEAHLLRYITDKYKANKIGQDWNFNGKFISREVTSGKYETNNG